MPSPFQGIETSRRALNAFQRSLDTTGHNIANVNTQGYSRQRAELAVGIPNTYSAGRNINLGSGVNLVQISRARDTFLESRRQDINGDQGRSEAGLSLLERVQSSFLDVSGKGISSALDSFYNSWSSLANDPSSTTNRQAVIASARDLSTKVRTAYSDLKAVSDSQTKGVTDTITQIQSYADQIGKLNSDIRANIAGGGLPNDLMDQRDQAVAELSKLVNIDTNLSSDNSLSVFVGSLPLVDQVGARQFPTNFNASTSTVNDGGATNWPISGGVLKGQFDGLGDVAQYMTQLDSLANTIRSQVNSLHQSGVTNSGAAGGFFFSDNATTPILGAANLYVDSAVETNPALLVTGTTSAAGDGTIATAMSKLRDQTVAGLGGQSTRGYFSTLLATVGRDIATAKNDRDTAYALGEQVESQVQDVSGVNLDDELANLQQFQRSYQASAKVLSVMDETLSDLINMLKR
ncbi:MAG: flagellar hook-associated protein FlgK [Armatimonadota bacterium]